MGTWFRLLQSLDGLHEKNDRSARNAIATKVILSQLQQGLASDLLCDKEPGMSIGNTDIVNGPAIDLL